MLYFSILFIDFCHGLIDSIKGIAFIRRVLEEDRREVPAEPARAPRERTVLQMRRERLGIVRAPRSPPRVRDSFLKKLGKIYAMNAVFFVLWQLSVRALELCFSELGAAIGNALLVPLFVASRLVQTLWCSDICGACLRALRLPPPTQIAFVAMMGEMATCLTHSVFFMIQGLIWQFLPIPVFGNVLMLAHVAMLNSIYCFDYFFDNRNLSFLRRRLIFESHWPYFLGFGAPLTVACSLSSSFFFNGLVFAILFPFFIISSFPANWNRKYEQPIPRVAFFQVSYFFTQLVARFVKRITPRNDNIVNKNIINNNNNNNNNVAAQH